MIASIECETMYYEIGLDDVVAIVFFEEQKVNTIYQVHFLNGNTLLVGSADWSVNGVFP